MWPWARVRDAIDASGGDFRIFLRALPRSEIERLIVSVDHQRNVFGFYSGTNGERATEIVDDIFRRAADAPLSTSEGESKKQ